VKTLLLGLLLLGELNVAGSVYLNQPSLFSSRKEVLGATVQGMNAETSIKMAADISSSASAHLKFCHGCHGVEADMAYVEWEPSERFNLRAGRIPVPFGDFYLRYDPANHRSATKPLPYAMGRMLRRNDYNLAILPQPYPDQGLEISGTFRGERSELSYHIYAVAGLKGAENDLEFIQSRGVYWADNNRTPVVGTRLVWAFTELPGELWRWFALGLSALRGQYDREGELSYTILGMDLYARFAKFNLRGELLMRHTEIADHPQLYERELKDLYIQREGFSLQADTSINRYVEWLLRFDGFRRSGALAKGSSLKQSDSHILRYTAGLNLSPERALKLKINYEYWQFSDFEAEQILHTGIVGSF